ncbi:AAA family ATPase [Candidatus Nitrosopumilus sediminis]|uniref:Magnesium chelatase n=1 Tax=Candidatus Nitrosopumilus sediminis TaxID=1229909 RepID=K0BHA3_9ARCH|nr:MoxR family ATPase [Candidatus Nitrosopumilus sediminis]AFS83666.1 magnesium chelatase [Candidatus Nitrosopumilus sediminis]
MSQEITALTNQAEDFSVTLQSLQKEISKVIVGQDKIIEKLIVALLSKGHVLLEGVPGLAKTLLVQTLSDCINSKFVRLQFTPDLLPADILGTKIYDHASTSFKTIKGPIFSNFILADEINRAPPKVQSALLEAMQENQVSIQGETYQLEKPFFVMATQNPVESEGTYKLPEAQVDRFMFKILISYPTIEQESEIIQRFTEGISYKAARILSGEKLLEMQDFVPKIYADEKIRNYITQIVDATRFPTKYDLKLSHLIEYGASPRASIWLTISAKANALLQGRGFVIPKDVQDVVYDVLRHRIILTYEAESEDIATDNIIQKIIDKITIP